MLRERASGAIVSVVPASPASRDTPEEREPARFDRVIEGIIVARRVDFQVIARDRSPRTYDATLDPAPARFLNPVGSRALDAYRAQIIIANASNTERSVVIDEYV